MARIKLINVIKKYGNVTALDGLSFETKEGELFCLLGPSGAGKTTTLQVISGIEKPDGGDVLMNGTSVINMMPRERDIALAFESYALYPQLTVAENLSFPLESSMRRKEFTEEARNQRVKEVAELLNIGELLNRYPRELSGGERQRVGLGRALVRKPKLYLLDEPIAHLDAKLRHYMRGELKKIQSNLGITTIYSTPDQLEALSMADTIALINHGKVEQIGPPDQLFDNPSNTFVAKFVGDPPMNILDTRLENGDVVIDCDVNFQFPLPKDAPHSLADHAKKSKLLVGIRPKDIKLVSGDSKSKHTRGRVSDLDTLGQTTIVIVMVGCLELKVKVATEDAPSRDELISLELDTTKLHYFNAVNCQRIE